MLMTLVNVMNKSTPKFRHHPQLCEWCFESIPKGKKVFCSDFCIESAREWDHRAKSLQLWQEQAKKDLTRHRMDMLFGEGS